jgi:CheY-like chemotaxis protein
MPGGGQLTIETIGEEITSPGARAGLPIGPGPCVVIVVSDTGCGMTEEVRSHIFEPFFTTKDFGKGTGLGLATVYGIVQQSGGFIDVETTPDAGTQFRVGFPALTDTVTPKSARADGPSKSIGGGETVLLVEDNESVRDLAREALARNGYRVLEATNGEEGLRIATAHAGGLSLVVTDVVMPVMGGRELAARLLATSPNLPILFTSGYTDDSIVNDTATHPATSFIQKPFTPESLLGAIRDMLDRSGARESRAVAP